jgi:hypothetical protein
MKQSKDITAMVVDNGGSYLSFAPRLAKEYKTVYYSNPYWQDPYPLLKKTQIGVGIEGIQVVDNVWDVYDEIDLWIFLDTYSGPFIEWLKAQGEKVWGSGAGEELELERDLLKEQEQELGLAVQPWKAIQGMENLRVYLQENEDVYVKISKWRGTVETFHSINYKLIKPELDEMEHNLGPLSGQITFIVEDPIPAIMEAGWDGYIVDDKYPDSGLQGCEVKDKAYAGKFGKYTDLSPLITDFNEKMKPTFKFYNYRGFFSTEIRITEDKIPYMIDATCRSPHPPGEIYQTMYANLGEIIWAGANGELVNPIPTAKFAVELLMESEWSVKNYQPIYFPEQYKDNVKLKKATFIDGTYYIIPQLYGSNDIGAVVGQGETLEDAIKECTDVAKSIEGNDIHIRIDTLGQAQEEFAKFEALNKEPDDGHSDGDV